MKYLPLITLLLATTIFAQQGPPAGFFPPNMPQTYVGTVYATYCAFGNHICVRRRILAWGTVCHEGSLAIDDAKAFREDPSKIDGIVPPGFHYVGWDCKP